MFLISNFRRVLNIVYVLLGISPASDYGLPGPDRGYRNVGKPQSDAGEIPKRTYTIDTAGLGVGLMADSSGRTFKAFDTIGNGGRI
jgi:hypothetical protein